MPGGRPRTPRVRRALLTALVLATVGVVVSASCGGQFDPPSVVNSVRVITVEADSPYGSPGETITLKMRYDDGRPDVDDPQPLQITWLGGCFNPPGDQYYGCYQPLGELVARVQAGDVSPTEFLSQRPNFDTFPVTLPDDILSSRADPAFGTKVGTAFVFFAVCAGELRPVDDAGDTAAQSFPFGCFDASGKRLGADEFVPGYTVVSAYEDGRRNANPTVNGFLFDGEPLDELTTRRMAGRSCWARRRYTSADVRIHTLRSGEHCPPSPKGAASRRIGRSGMILPTRSCEPIERSRRSWLRAIG